MDKSKVIFRDDLLAGKTILVTGGGSGLGRQIAKSYAALGANIAICGRRSFVLDEAAAEIGEGAKGAVRTYVCDIAKTESVANMIASVWRDTPLTGLVNNAAGNFVSRTEDLSMNAFDAIANIVFRGTFNVTLEAGKRWIASGQCGTILSIVTTWVWNGSPFTVPSAMSKTAIHAMTQSLAVEWGRYGIRLNAIAPGPFPTEGAWERLWPKDGREIYDAKAGNPLGRVGEMHELANLAAFLMADGTDYLTGQTITIDGAAYQANGGNFSHLRTWDDERWASVREKIKETNARDKVLRDA